MSAVDAKCAAAGVSCSRRNRVIGAVTLNRVRVVLPASEPFKRLYVTGKDGVVLSVKGVYRADDRARVTRLSTSLGQPSEHRGNAAWTLPSGVVTETSLKGTSIRLTDTKAATARGIRLTPQALVTAPPKAASLGPAPSGALRPTLAGAVLDPTGGTPTPTVTRTLRVPVKITLLKLKCFDEQDMTSWFYGDDPYLNIVGSHTTPANQRAWFVQKAFSNVESGDTKNVDQAVFPDGDLRRALTVGEAVGAQITLIEGDLGNDDEIDFTYPIVDYGTAVSMQNKTQNVVEKLEGDGAVYTLSYKIEYGAGQTDTTLPPFRYRPVDARAYAGRYSGSVGAATSNANLLYLASKDPSYPNGVLRGTLSDGSVEAVVTTLRLQGSSIDLAVRYPSGSPGVLNGYLVGDGGARRLVGTLTRDGATRGVALALASGAAPAVLDAPKTAK
ncbi:MAG: hypothetical protein KF850_04590 [Labilithrix sp.]|nr:hypothetical protein [Labilithrix sp.]